LADLGADVVKVEKRDGGDDFRRQAPLHDGVSLWWKASARNKRSIALDLKDDADRATFLALVAEADVVTANFVPGTLERLGFGYDDLAAAHPGLVMVSVSGYGQDGPYRSRRAFGRNAEAFGGLAQVTGYADGPPLPTGCPVADCYSALLGAFAGLCALYARARDPQGRGQLVDVALYETVFRLLELTALVYDQSGIDSAHSETGTVTGELFCVAETRDGHWVSASGWGTGPVRFAADAADGIGAPERARVLDTVRTFVASSTLAEVLAAPSPVAGIACTPVMRIDELFADPVVRERASVVTVVDPDLDEVAVAAVVPRLTRTPGTVHHAAPRLDGGAGAVRREWRRG
jgi:crotonobetainyl-CoA:carnitine CoA-transferase CaiB-like acyl-CoA transferase